VAAGRCGGVTDENGEMETQGPVDEDEGLAIPRNEEEALREPVSDEVHEKAAEVSRSTEVEGSTDIAGTGGGSRFWGADTPSDE